MPTEALWKTKGFLDTALIASLPFDNQIGNNSVGMDRFYFWQRVFV